MTDPQRRAVEAIAQYEMDTCTLPSSDSLEFYIPWAQDGITALREANLIILDRETVAAAVAVAKSFTPRWTEYECFTQMQDALGDADA